MRSSHQGKKEVACIVSKLLDSCLWRYGESVNPPKLNIQEVKGICRKGRPRPARVFFFPRTNGANFYEIPIFLNLLSFNKRFFKRNVFQKWPRSSWEKKIRGPLPNFQDCLSHHWKLGGWCTHLNKGLIHGDKQEGTLPAPSPLPPLSPFPSPVPGIQQSPKTKGSIYVAYNFLFKWSGYTFVKCLGLQLHSNAF